MLARTLTLLVVTLGCISAAPADNLASDKSTVLQKIDQSNDDLKTASSAYQGYNGYSGGNPSSFSSYQGSGSGVTGYGVIDYGAGGAGGGYNRNYGYSSYPGNTGYSSSYPGNNGYSSSYPGNIGYSSSYPSNNGYSGYGGYKNYDGYDGYSGYKGYGGNVGNGGGYGLAGNGGYGGYGGNGGLTSYYGYNDPYYQGAYHLGYGYTAKRHGNIYSNSITPSLVTGYRGYTRR